jgi:Lhr-like helicase
VPTKRGVHLMLSIERLAAFAETPPQRIGLSATQRPLDEVARFLGGAEGAGVRWPGGDAALLVLVPVVAAVSLGYAAWLRRAHRLSAVAGESQPRTAWSETEGVTG